MNYEILANVIVVFHFAFVIFVGLGGFLVLKWRRWAWFHIPVFVWGALISFGGWVCPLTPFENWLRVRAGETSYSTTFIEHYILPILYPAGLTREVQIPLGFLVLGINIAIYGWIFRRRKKS